MLSHILVPLDGTPQSAVTLPLARTVARATGAEIELVRVVPAHPGNEALAVAAREYLDRIVGELGVDGVRVATSVLIGHPASEILAEAGRHRADAIVMATRGRTGLQRAILGSVSERVLHASAAPVLLVRPGGHRVTRVQTLLVPVDGTPGSALAISVARRWALETHARVVLAQVVVPLPRYAEGFYVAPEWDEETRRSAQAYLDRLAQALVRAGVTATAVARIGQVAATLAATAEDVDADLVVMSTHALTGPERALLGSVADEMVRTCSRPVLLVKQRTPATRRGESVESAEETRRDQEAVDIAV